MPSTTAKPADTPCPAGPQPRLTVAICTRNRSALLEKAVASVAPWAGPETEILIVDNSSTDNTAQVAARLAANYPSVRCHREEQLGLSAARNTALRIARAAFVVFLDDDAVAEPGWLRAYLDFAARPPTERVAVIGGPVFPEYECPPPSWFSAERNALDLGPEPKRVRAHGGPWGCNIGYHRERALAAGGFDSRLGRRGSGMAAHEESELNERLERSGYEVWWVPGARIRHFFTANRLSLGFELRSQFAEGKSAVVGRLRKFGGPGARAFYSATRLLVAPFHALLNFTVFLCAFPFSRQTAFSNLRQSVRNLGFMCGLMGRVFSR